MGENAARDVFPLAMTDALKRKAYPMLDTTITAAAAIFAADPTMTPGERRARLDPNLAHMNAEPLDEIFTPVETQKILKRDRHTLAAWAKRGLLTAVRTGARGMNVTGYTGASVRALLAGNVNANGNNVDAEEEAMLILKTQLQYQLLTQMENFQFAQMKIALK